MLIQPLKCWRYVPLLNHLCFSVRAVLHCDLENVGISGNSKCKWPSLAETPQNYKSPAEKHPSTEQLGNQTSRKGYIFELWNPLRTGFLRMNIVGGCKPHVFSGSQQVVGGVHSGNRDGCRVWKWGWGSKGTDCLVFQDMLDTWKFRRNLQCFKNWNQFKHLEESEGQTKHASGPESAFRNPGGDHWFNSRWYMNLSALD